MEGGETMKRSEGDTNRSDRHGAPITRRRAIAALLVAISSVVIAPIADADMAPPPVLLHIQGHDAALTALAPDRAEFTLTNSGSEAMEVFLYRVIMLDGSTRIPVDIDGVEVDGRAAGRTVTIPANGRVRIAARFELPRSMHGRASYRIDLSVRQSGFGALESTPATIARRGAHARGKWAVEPK
jgi:hypothetical protein